MFTLYKSSRNSCFLNIREDTYNLKITFIIRQKKHQYHLKQEFRSSPNCPFSQIHEELMYAKISTFTVFIQSVIYSFCYLSSTISDESLPAHQSTNLYENAAAGTDYIPHEYLQMLQCKGNDIISSLGYTCKTLSLFLATTYTCSLTN